MPYIPKASREAMVTGAAESPGDLNYQFTMLAILYVRRNGLSYQTINDVVGALEGAKAEFQRRIVNPYEDTKIVANGDLYEGVLHQFGLKGGK